MNLTEQPEIINWPPTHYVYVEKTGPFQETAQKCWEELHQLLPGLSKSQAATGFMSLYKIEPEMVYRAGAILAAKPEILPTGLSYFYFHGGKYSKFVMTGPYDNLPEACGRVFEIVERTQIPVRDDFFIEYYLNDPKVTAPEKLQTEISIPTK